jgi:thiol-disulfide isomerase/thioredoxin
MKKFIPLLLCIFSIASAQEKSFTLNLQLKGVEEGTKVFLSHKYDDQTLIDSSLVKKGTAEFKGKTPEPNMYWITFTKNENPTLIFFIDGGKVAISAHRDSLAKAVVKAGKTQEDYKQVMDFTSKFNATKNGLHQRFQLCNSRGDQKCAQAIIDTAMLTEIKYINDLFTFIKKNPESNTGGYIIFSSVFDWPSIPTYDSLYNALGAKVKNGKFGKLALNKINSIKGTTIGYPAIDFIQANAEGKSISLSSFKGKVVLVDFWASWCGPCRKENPNVVAAYNKYKSKGFDIFGVSFDDNKDRWLNAVQKDGLAWTQVSDLKGWGNEAGKLYGVSSIPFNLLLDKDGKILAKGLRGADLEAALAQIFGE